MKTAVRMLLTVSVAVAALVGAVVFATPGRSTADPCPPDRDLMSGGAAFAADDPGYESIGEAAAVVAKDVGYEPLTEDDLRRIESAAAHPIQTFPDGRITIDPNLRDTEVAVDLVIHVQRTDDGRYLPAGQSFCALVLSGDDPA